MYLCYNPVYNANSMKLKASTDFAYQLYYPTPVIAMLNPRTDFNQVVHHATIHVSPNAPIREYYDVYGNACQRILLPQGTIHLKTETIVEVSPTVARNESAAYVNIENLPVEALQFLLPSRYCVSDSEEVRQLAYQLTGAISMGYLQVEAIRSWIHKHISYQYGFTFSSTNSTDILVNRIGVCRDFAHLGIALCRSINIPARMVVGFLKDLPFSDLHAWFEAFIGGHWYAFDAVQEHTTGGRIVLAYGRDATDVAFITQFGSSVLLSMDVKVEEA